LAPLSEAYTVEVELLSPDGQTPSALRSRRHIQGIPLLTPNCCGKNSVKHHHCVWRLIVKIIKREVFILAGMGSI